MKEIIGGARGGGRPEVGWVFDCRGQIERLEWRLLKRREKSPFYFLFFITHKIILRCRFLEGTL